VGLEVEKKLSETGQWVPHCGKRTVGFDGADPRSGRATARREHMGDKEDVKVKLDKKGGIL